MSGTHNCWAVPMKSTQSTRLRRSTKIDCSSENIAETDSLVTFFDAPTEGDCIGAGKWIEQTCVKNADPGKQIEQTRLKIADPGKWIELTCVKIADPRKWIEQTCVEIADGIRRCHFIALALRGKKISYHLRALRLFPRSLRRAMASLP